MVSAHASSWLRRGVVLATLAVVSVPDARADGPIPPLSAVLPRDAEVVARLLEGERLELFIAFSGGAAGRVDERMIEEVSRAALEDAFEAGRRVSGVIPWVAHEGQWVPMPALLPPLAPVPEKAHERIVAARSSVSIGAGGRRRGALSGKVVYVSAGHGFTWDPALDRWATQRGNTHDIVEDLVSAEAIDQLLTTYLENAGATVFTVRERDLNPHMVIVDAGSGGAGAASGTGDISKVEYLENRGDWVDSTGTGFENGLAPYVGGVNPFATGTSRVAMTSAAVTAEATWRFEVPRSGDYRVYASWVAGANRAPDAHYAVSHAGGVSRLRVDQRRHGGTWVSLGWFHFRAGERYQVALSNDSATAGAWVSADAIRVGGGMGDAARGAGGAVPRSRTSERPRWEENARYHIQFSGAPASVYAYTGDERSDDVGARSRYAAWQNEAGEDAVYVAWHTNAPSPGVGTSTFVYGPNPPDGSYDFTGAAGSDRLGRLLHDEVVNDLKRAIDPGWRDRGLYTAYFGEVNPRHNDEMPSALCEVAFHATESDAARLKEPEVRRVAARAFYQAIVKYFAERDGVAAQLLPEPPTGFAVEVDGSRATLSWEAPVVDEVGLGGDAATGYRLYRSPNGRGFDEGVSLGALPVVAGRVRATVEGLAPGEVVFYRVTAENEGGESMPSTVLGVNPPCRGRPEALVVHGFHRLDSGLASRDDLSAWGLGSVVRMRLGAMNRFDATVHHAVALAAAGVAFDSAETTALPELSSYRLLDWVLGEESTADETFSAGEREAVRSWLEGGGRWLVTSGSELAWDLGRGDPDAVAFLATLGASFGDDDAGTNVLTSPLVGEPLLLDDGTMGTYDVNFPDVLVPMAGAEVVLRYGDGRVAGVKAAAGASVVLTFGVPLESIFPDTARERLIAELLSGAPVERIGVCGAGDEPIGPVEPVEPAEPGPEVGEGDGAEGVEVSEGARGLRPSRTTFTDVREVQGGCGGGQGGQTLLLPLLVLIVFCWRVRVALGRDIVAPVQGPRIRTRSGLTRRRDPS